MKRDRVLQILKEHQTTLKELGVRSFALFGSVARDEARPDSDVDVLVELEPPYTFDRYMDVKFFLEDHLGAKVDLVMQGRLHPLVRENVERDLIQVT